MEFEEFLGSMRRTIHSHAWRHSRGLPAALDLDDLEAAGRIGAWEGWMSCPDPENVQRYSNPAIERTIIDEVRKLLPRGYRRSKRRRPVWSQSELETTPDVAETVQSMEMSYLLDAALYKLTPTKRSVMRDLLAGHTLRSAGNRAGLTESRACLIRKECVAVLRRLLEG